MQVHRVLIVIFPSRFLAGAPVAQWLALRAYSRVTTMVIPKSRSCEERDGRGFKPLLEHLSFFLLNFKFHLNALTSE